MARAALTQEVARRRLLVETFSASSRIGPEATGDASEEVPAAEWEMHLEMESATAVAREREELKARNCSTAGCGLSSLALALISAYMLHGGSKLHLELQISAYI